MKPSSRRTARRNSLRTLLRGTAPLLLAPAALAQTITVTTGADVIDIAPTTATVADLPGPDGLVSFSEAMIASNNTPGRQTVEFNIPQSLWTLQFLYPGRAVLQSSVGFYFRAFDEVTIDGTSQTAFTGDTNLGGNEVVISGPELYLNADGCTLIGFDSSSVTGTASGILIENNIAMNITLFGGSGNVVRGNTGGTIKIDRSDDNDIVGNTVQRIRVWGFGSSEPALDNRIGGPALADRNFLTGYGTWNSDGYPSGTTLQLFQTRGTVVENNWIGTTPDGLAQGSLASNVGIGIETENHDLTIRDNRIAGILGHGQGPHAAGLLFGWAVLFSGTGSNIELVGNTIGLDANGSPSLGSVWGIDVGNPVTHPFSGTDVRIGGAGPGEGNEIAGHIFNGVTVGRSAGEVRLTGNSVHDNGGLGIDLVSSAFETGPSANDALDADTGGNGLQNHPVLSAAQSLGTMVLVLGSLDSAPSSQFTVELFASPTCDGSGSGEGSLSLGTSAVITDATGHADLSVQVPASAPVGWVVTATATLEPVGATSEFSACVPLADDSVGSSVCNGDGGDQLGCTDCPCGNQATPGTLGGCLNSALDSARLLATGDPSVSLPSGATDDLRFALSGAPAGVLCVLTSGDAVAPQNAANPCFGLQSGVLSAEYDGLRCAVGATRRHGGRTTDASGQVGIATGPWGGEGNPPAGIVAAAGWLAGQSRSFQVVYRDDPHAACLRGLNTTQAVSITFAP